MEFKVEISYEGIIGPFVIEGGRYGRDIVAVKSHDEKLRRHVIINVIQALCF